MEEYVQYFRRALAITSTLTRTWSAGSAPCGHHGHRCAPGRHSERFCGAHGLIQHLPLHTRPRADPTRCLKCPSCNISSVVHLHASMVEPIGSTSPCTVQVGAKVESRASIAIETVPLIVDHGPVPSWPRQRAWSPPFLASWWLAGLALHVETLRQGSSARPFDSEADSWTVALARVWRVQP